MNESLLKPYSIGIVVRNKEVWSDTIFVTPIESISVQKSGELENNKKTYESKIKDSDNNGFDTTMQSSDFLPAKWTSLGVDNRLTAPDVYAGEHVMLYKYGDVEEYYWSTMLREPTLRRQETVLYCWSNLKDGRAAYDLKTSYWVLVDTRKKKIQMHTNDNDGEITTYDITINTGEGFINIKDGKGNSIELNSANDSLEAKIGKTINMEAGDSITCKASSITLDGETTVTKNLNVAKTTTTKNLVFGDAKAGGGGGSLSANSIEASQINASYIHGSTISEG